MPTLFFRFRTAGEKALNPNYKPKRGRGRTASSCVQELPPKIGTGGVLKVGDGLCACGDDHGGRSQGVTVGIE